MSRKAKRVVLIVGLFLAAVMLLVVIGKASSGFTDFEDMALRRVNEKNLWQSMEFPNDGKISNGQYGLTVKVNEDGQVKINGTSVEGHVYELATGTLAKDTAYIFKSGLTNGNVKTMHIEIRTTEAENYRVLAASYEGFQNITALSEDTAVKVVLVVFDEGVSANNVTLEPVLCAGTEETDLVNFWK